MNEVLKFKCWRKNQKQTSDPANPEFVDFTVNLSHESREDEELHNLSGISSLEIGGVTRDAADLFDVGKVYDITINLSDD